MATLSIWNYFHCPNMGSDVTGKQGSTTDAPQTPFDVTVSGYVHKVTGSLADDAIVTIWDEEDDKPVDFNYMHLWTDQDCYVQVIGQTTNFIVPITAKVPYILSYNTLLAAADTTVMTAGVAPSVEEIDSIVLSNMSGSAMNYVACFVD